MEDVTSPAIRRLAIVLAALVAAGIAVAAFVLSFAALWDVATRVWPSRHLSWLGPVVVDATILQATVSLVAVSSSTRVGERRYFWALLIGAASTSVAGNALHAVVPADQPLAPWVAALIATIPPVFLLLSTHSLTLLIRRRPESAAATDSAVSPSVGEDRVVDVPGFDEDIVEGPRETVPTVGVLADSHGVHEGTDEGGLTPRDFVPQARSLREEHGLSTTVPQIAAVLHHRATAPDASLREHAAAGNVHHNTAKKILDVEATAQRVSA